MPRANGLTGEQQRAYARDGFVFPLRILEAAEIEELRARVDHLVARLDELEPRLYEVERGYAERPGEVVCHFLGGWRVDAALRGLVFDRRITVPCAQALGVRRLRLWHDQVFCKPPRHPGVVPWHQDWSYWQRTWPANHVTLNLMLDDATLESGCVHFVPGSHRGGLLPKSRFDGPMQQVGGADGAVPALLRAGEASLHHSHTLHGSHANRSDRPRRALVFNYMGAKTRSADGTTPLLRGVPLVPEGEVIEGEHFPIVLDLGE
jgi:ectoine hydroxylase-related dioxygenase (phytanoyl-CoA dioxygenase family)